MNKAMQPVPLHGVDRYRKAEVHDGKKEVVK